MKLDRRGFLGLTGGLIVAPAIVRYASIMPVRVPLWTPPRAEVRLYDSLDKLIAVAPVLGKFEDGMVPPAEARYVATTPVTVSRIDLLIGDFVSTIPSSRPEPMHLRADDTLRIICPEVVGYNV